MGVVLFSFDVLLGLQVQVVSLLLVRVGCECISKLGT
jgi:hypothetical protein